MTDQLRLNDILDPEADNAPIVTDQEFVDVYAIEGGGNAQVEPDKLSGLKRSAGDVDQLVSVGTLNRRFAGLVSRDEYLKRELIALAAAAGGSLRSGAGVPAGDVGALGDIYYRTDTTQIYGPKTVNGWGDPVSLRGTDGDDGAPGAPGAVGAAGANWTPGASGFGFKPEALDAGKTLRFTMTHPGATAIDADNPLTVVMPTGSTADAREATTTLNTTNHTQASFNFGTTTFGFGTNKTERVHLWLLRCHYGNTGQKIMQLGASGSIGVASADPGVDDLVGSSAVNWSRGKYAPANTRSDVIITPFSPLASTAAKVIGIDFTGVPAAGDSIVVRIRGYDPTDASEIDWTAEYVTVADDNTVAKLRDKLTFAINASEINTGTGKPCAAATAGPHPVNPAIPGMYLIPATDDVLGTDVFVTVTRAPGSTLSAGNYAWQKFMPNEAIHYARALYLGSIRVWRRDSNKTWDISSVDPDIALGQPAQAVADYAHKRWYDAVAHADAWAAQGAGFERTFSTPQVALADAVAAPAIPAVAVAVHWDASIFGYGPNVAIADDTEIPIGTGGVYEVGATLVVNMPEAGTVTLGVTLGRRGVITTRLKRTFKITATGEQTIVLRELCAAAVNGEGFIPNDLFFMELEASGGTLNLAGGSTFHALLKRAHQAPAADNGWGSIATSHS